MATPPRSALLLSVALAACVQDWSRPWHDAGSPLDPWVRVPNGRFTMGSPQTEPCRDANEAQRQVLLTRRFQLMRLEVGRGEFQHLMGSQPSLPGCDEDGCPVNNIDWHQAAAYCNALSTQVGLPGCYECSGNPWHCRVPSTFQGPAVYGCQGYRLPTTAEWEWSYRAGSQTALYSGAIDVCDGTVAAADSIAWYEANASGKLHARGTRQANAWGLYDMAGNALEWTHDGNAPFVDSVDPVGDDDDDTKSTSRGLRGGSFRDAPGALRGAGIRISPPGLRTDETGFRCARTLPVAQQAVLNKITLPSQPGDFAFDLDGTGPKNNLGNLIAVATGMGIDLRLQQHLARGDLLLLFELGGNSIQDQTSASLQVLNGKDADSNPGNNFSGSASLAIDPRTTTASVLEGPLQGGRLQASGPLLMPLLIARDREPVPLSLLPLGRVDLTFSAAGATGQIGGALTAADFEGTLIPTLASAMTWMLDPTNPLVGQAQRDLIKAAVGDAACADGVITPQELTDSVIGRSVSPDLDLDGDGTRDAYSIGIGVKLVTCRIAR
jgi:formylglycine-generating enzyme required for sulfatase activity